MCKLKIGVSTCTACYSCRRASEINMPKEPPSASLDQGLATNNVAAYVRRNQIASDQLGTLIATVHQALSGLRKPAPGTETERTPAVPIRRSVSANYVVCLECGWRAKMLRRHLQVSHGLNPQDYRSRWKLAPDHPLTAPAYSEKRSALAKQLGFGQKRTGRRG